MNTLKKYEKYLYVIILIGTIIYFPIFFNGFVWDDISYIITNPQVHQLNLLSVLSNNMFNSSIFYRPIGAIYFSFLYSFAGNNAFPYHLIQLLLHITDTILLFFYFVLFFSDGLAFFLALLFLVHPINVESVAYIDATLSELYFLPGITALLLSHKQSISRNRLIVITALLLLSALTKETGILFFFVLLFYRYLFKLNKMKEFIGAGIAISVIYIVLRSFAGKVTYSMLGFVQLTTIPFWQRLYLIPETVLYYIKTFFFPLQLEIWQVWVIREPTLGNFFFPLLLSIILFVFLFVVWHHIYKKDKKVTLSSPEQIEKNTKSSLSEQQNSKQFLFFFIWYVTGMVILLQFLALDMTVADRWFYFPIVGVLGMLGVGLQVLLPSLKQNSKTYLYIAIIIISIFSLRTFIRTFDWKDNLTLYSHDIKDESNNYLLLDAYAQVFEEQGNIDAFCYYENKSISIYPTNASLNELGNCFLLKSHYGDAISAYTRSINLSKTMHYSILVPYINLANTYLHAKEPSKAINFITSQALKVYPQNANLYSILAIAYVETKDFPDASKAAANAYKLSPDSDTENLYNQIQNMMEHQK